jgi:hypothetical protein
MVAFTTRANSPSCHCADRSWIAVSVSRLIIETHEGAVFQFAYGEPIGDCIVWFSRCCQRAGSKRRKQNGSLSIDSDRDRWLARHRLRRRKGVSRPGLQCCSTSLDVTKSKRTAFVTQAGLGGCDLGEAATPARVAEAAISKFSPTDALVTVRGYISPGLYRLYDR